MMMRSLAIGIPVYNRRQLVELNAFSLSRARVPSGLELRILVVDDCSTEFDANLLGKIYPPEAIIIRRKSRSGGADFAAAELLRLLVQNGADTVMILDSDFIMRSDFMFIIAETLSSTDGFLSLFNTENHPTVAEIGRCIIKSSIGAAGTVWTRQIAQKVLDNVPAGKRWDWRFGEYLREQGIRLFCLKDSALQHIGFADGENSNLGHGDFGKGFSDQTIEHLYFLTEEIVRMQRRCYKRLDERLRNIEKVLSVKSR